MPPSVSIVIPAYREGETLESTLASLEGQPGEVIVVYVGRETGRVARQHPRTDRVIEDELADGPGRARNIGANAASGDVVLFTDAETVVGPEWVETHRQHYTDDDVVGVGGPVRPRSDALKHRVLFALLSDYWYRGSWLVGFYQLSGWNCSYRKRTFQAEGGFDTSLPFMEDTELSLRMKDRGTLAYDATCWTATSVRRHEKEGYLGLFLQYVLAYVQYYLLDTDIDGVYFPSDENVSSTEVYESPRSEH
ncbi:MAG: glycosyltransferase [Halanaeroarchaeum sp.]